MPEHRTWRLLLEMEQIHDSAEDPVVALCGFLEPVHVLLELLRVGPGGAVNALQHLVPGVAAPVGAGDSQ
jgi:hypothetical protein